MRRKIKTVMEQMNAEKPDDVLADLERKHGCAAPTGSAATCDWHVSAEHKCGETAEWEMLDEEWREQVPVCSAHADQARSDGFQVRKRQNDELKNGGQ